MLVRRLIHQRMASYYSQPAHSVIGTIPRAINLSSLWGEWHWKWVYGNLYKSQQGQWLTPVELFRPYYSNCVANFVLQSIPSDAEAVDGMDIVELGGGRGTNAALVMDHIMKTQPQIYDKVQYTILDSSPPLVELQRQTLAASNHGDKTRVEHKDLLDVAEGRKPLISATTSSSGRCLVVLALEVLDNLPHDKVRIRPGNHLEQAQVRSTEDGSLREEFVPLSDRLLKEILQVTPSCYKRASVAWVPSVAYGLLLQLAKQQGAASTTIVIADFDWLPPPDRLQTDISARDGALIPPAAGEPLVTSMEGVDLRSYLTAPPMSDILFPTDFRMLAEFTRNAWNCRTRIIPDVAVHKQAQFLAKYGPEQVLRTKSWLTGYSPLLQDFSNCSVMTLTIKPEL